MICNFHDYQLHALDHLLENDASLLAIDMGLGKTLITLTAIERLIYDSFEIRNALVIAPLKVAEDTWESEIRKWNHLRHLRISKILGPENRRIDALKRKAQIYIINRENVVWLSTFLGGGCPFDMVVIDESSSFKDAGSKRFKALRFMMPLAKRRVALTGTPTPNSMLELWPQMYLLDQGERLGKTITEYKSKYFRIENPYTPYPKWVLHTDDATRKGPNTYTQKIYDQISDICISMKADDYLTLPEKITITTEIHLPPADMSRYKQFERELILSMEDQEITAANAAVLTGKLLQFASGAVYDSDKNVHVVHKHKIAVLYEKVEACLASGNPVMIAYWYKHERERIMKALAAFKPQCLDGNTSEIIKGWNEGKIPVLLIHPASAGHGLNMQGGGDTLIWFSQIWSLELYMQTIARIYRQGRKRPVLIDHLCVMGTVEEKAVEAKIEKQKGQDALLDAVKAMVRAVRGRPIQKAYTTNLLS